METVRVHGDSCTDHFCQKWLLRPSIRNIFSVGFIYLGSQRGGSCALHCGVDPLPSGMTPIRFLFLSRVLGIEESQVLRNFFFIDCRPLSNMERLVQVGLQWGGSQIPSACVLQASCIVGNLVQVESGQCRFSGPDCVAVYRGGLVPLLGIPRLFLVAGPLGYSCIIVPDLHFSLMELQHPDAS